MKINWFIPSTSFHRYVPAVIQKSFKLGYSDFNRLSASVWIRCLQLIPYLEELGIKSTINDERASGDIAIFVRSQDDQTLERLKRQKSRGKKIIFDQCVNYFDPYQVQEGNYGSSEQQKDEIHQMLEEADLFTCASDFIAQRAMSEGYNAKYVPDSVDLRHFYLEKPKKDFFQSKISTVWSGQACKANDLYPIIPFLKKHDIPLVIIADYRPQLEIDFKFIPWKYETFPESILQGEICLSPRRIDNPYDKGHSSFKIGVFMGQGVPALASPVPSYQELLSVTGAGRICDDLAAWDDAISQIVSERDKIWNWSQAALGKMEPYSTAAVSKQYSKLLHELVSTHGR